MLFLKKTRSEQIKLIELALRRSFDMDWCHCMGKGSWTEQIDGTKTCVVRCPKHYDYTKEVPK